MRTLLLLFLLLPASCFVARRHVNEPIVPEALAQLEPGTTTAKEVVALLGAPAEVVQLGRRTAYRYDHRLTKRAGIALLVVFLLNEDTHEDRVWVFFDESDVLTHVGATLEAETSEYAMPWEDLED